jgi:anti-sigma factor (TIGR02949 family)
MRCDEAQEWITASVDNQLSAEERSALGNHLADCRDCRAQLERETALKRDLKRVAASVTIPQELRSRIAARVRQSQTDASVASRGFERRWFRVSHLRPAWAFALALVIVAAIAFQFRPGEDMASMALSTHESILNGKETLVRVDDVGQLRRDLALAVNNRFAPIALDLSMANLRPVAGLVKKIGERQVLVTVYEGDGPTITCYTFLGSEADAPKDSERFRDDQMRVDFYIFSKAATSAVLHEEGEVICILVSKRAPAELLDLLRGKAHHA